MTLERDPPRLFEPESGADPLLREALHMAATHGPSSAQLEALAAGVAAATAAGTTLALIAKLQALLAKSALTKLSVVLVLGGSAVWVSQHWQAAGEGGRAAPSAALRSEAMPESRAQVDRPADALSGGASQPRSSAHLQLVQPQPAVEPAPAPDALLEATAVPQATPEVPVATAGEFPHATNDVAPTAAPSARSSTTTATDVPETHGLPETTTRGGKPMKRATTPRKARPRPVAAAPELELLTSAQSLLARDPAAALAAIEEHARAYPRGNFAEEREALAIDALRRLGRRQDLRQRAAAFLESYPRSPHRERVQALLE
jgi:hypothetical protein